MHVVVGSFFQIHGINTPTTRIGYQQDFVPFFPVRSYCLFVDIIVVDDSVIIFVATRTEDVEEELYEFDSLNFSVASNILVRRLLES